MHKEYSHVTCEPTVIPGQGDLPAAVIYSFFDSSRKPQGVIMYSPISPRVEYQNSQQQHLASALYKESLNIPGLEDKGLQKWIMAEQRFHEEFPLALRYTLETNTPPGWITRHLPDVWSALAKSGKNITQLWSGLDGKTQAWTWAIRP